MRISDWSSDVCASDLVRNEMGLTNVEIMVPFVRTTTQAKKVVDLLAKNGLARGENGLRLIMMWSGVTELPWWWSMFKSGFVRSEERRVGKEGVSKCRSRLATDH